MIHTCIIITLFILFFYFVYILCKNIKGGNTLKKNQKITKTKTSPIKNKISNINNLTKNQTSDINNSIKNQTPYINNLTEDTSKQIDTELYSTPELSQSELIDNNNNISLNFKDLKKPISSTKFIIGNIILLKNNKFFFYLYINIDDLFK